MAYNSEKMFLKSQKMFEERKLDQAVRVLENIIAKDPTYLKAYYSLGYTYMEKDENAKAERILLKAIELSPKWDTAHLQLGKAYENQQKWEQALSSYQQAVNLNPENPHARMHLGIIHQVLGNLKSSVQELQVAYQSSLYDFEVVYNLANGLYGLNQPVKALEVLDESLTASEFDTQDLAHLHNLRGNIYLYLGKLDEAYTSLKKATEIAPTLLSFFVDLGEVCFEKGQWEEAIDWYKQAINSEADKGKALRGIGYSYLSLEDWKAAASYLEKAQELGIAVFFGLGVAYFELGDDEKGIKNLKNEILNDGPAKTEASYYLGFAYASVGDRVSSVEAFKQFLELSADDADRLEWKEWRTEAKKQIEEQE
jgi:tetratricopeptide (TPR) repeat protein